MNYIVTKYGERKYIIVECRKEIVNVELKRNFAYKK